MKVYILTDLEGAAGVFSFEDTYTTGRFYERARHLLTREVNAAVAGAAAPSGPG